MDFFAAQERARKTSRWLVWWFALCVIAVVAVLYLLAVWGKPLYLEKQGFVSTEFVWWDRDLAAIIAPSASGIIVLGSLYKLMQLSGGGRVVARDLGGRAIDPSTSDPLERRLLNVVEEMALASGLAAPEVWVMDDEDGINAFAAGTDPSNAVIGVTRGCLERLNRSELQGVVAHEFSHILNGDMKLNMRLMGWIFGLVMIAMLGRMLLELLRHFRSSRDSKGASPLLVVAVAGIALWVIGSVGVFFAKLLQAGVSRQREYLADASAVQFTRNPTGLADALRKIGGFPRNGTLQTAKAAEARHLFFVKSDLLSMGFATHPPLEKRIKEIDPSWNGTMMGSSVERVFPELELKKPARAAAMLAPVPKPISLDRLGDSARLDPKVGAAILQQLGEGNIVFESKMQAKAVLYGLLLAQDTKWAEATIHLLRQRTDGEMVDRAVIWKQHLTGKTSAEKLAMVDLSLPWLRRMSAEEATAFIAVTGQLILADGRVNLFEFMLQKVIARQVAVGLGLRQVAKIRHRNLRSLQSEIGLLLGTFGSVSGDSVSMERAAAEFEAHTGVSLGYLSANVADLNSLSKVLIELEAATPLVKVQALRMCGLVASHDGVLQDEEVELLRAVAEAIGAPLPPLGIVTA